MPSWKKVVASGSDASFSSLTVDTYVSASSFNGSFTGSLQGTSSQAISSSYALTASYALISTEPIIVTSPGGIYYINGVAKPVLTFVPGQNYRFDTTAVDGHHPFKFSLTANGPTQYTYGVTSGSGFIEINVDYATSSSLFYYCTIHSGMGNQANTLRDENLIHNSQTSSMSVLSASYAYTASSATNAAQAISASYSYTASSATNSEQAISASYAFTASSAISSSYAYTASSATNANSALTASSADTFLVRNDITASSALITGTLTAQTLVVQTVTSSVIYSSGSNTFGNALTDRQTFTGSVNITGSLSVNGSEAILTNQTASMSVASAVSASYALNGGVTQILAGANVTLSPTSGKGQVTISATGGAGPFFNTATGSYGSFYDTTTQTNPVANTPRSMSFNTTDITNGVSISGSTSPFNTYIKTENPGVYDIQFSAQLDKTDAGKDEIVIWLRKNGTDLTDTATSISLTNNNDKVVAAWNWFVNSAANDYYQIIWYSADPDLRILAETAGGGHPGIPSVIATVNRVDQFLSNSGSFSGSFSGALTGSLFGTSSWAQNASTASYVVTAQTASYVENAISASYAYTASSAISAYTASSAQTSFSSISSSYALTASYALNAGASSGFPFTGSAQITGSLGVTGSFSVNGNTGQTVFASNADTLVISGSLIVTGSSQVTGSLNVLGGITGSLFGTASWAQNAVSASQSVSSSYALTASYALFAANGGGGGVSAIYILDEGVVQGTASYFDFTGAGVTATVNAGTASINIPGGGGGSNTNSQNAILSQTSPAVTWSFTHNLSTLYPVFTIYDNEDNVIIPQKIHAETTSSAFIYFSSARTGTAVASKGGDITSASFAATASLANFATSASYSFTASSAISASLAQTASYVATAQTASYVLNAVSASYAFTASSAINASASLIAVSASQAATASSADTFVVRNDITASNALITGTITAQTLVVQTITSSIAYSSGSNIFGNSTANTQTFTGSVNITGSLNLNGKATLTDLTGSLFGTASWAQNALTASYVVTAQTASYVSSNFQHEIHVSQVDGNDTTGNGDLLNPVASITKALTLTTSSRKTIIVHPGTYSENITVGTTNTTIATSELTGANTLLSGTLTIGTSGSGSRISGLKMTNLVISGTAQAYISNCTVDNQVTKSSSGYVEIINSEMQCTLGIQISGAGTTIINGNKNVGIAVSNASAQVIIKGCNSVVTPSASAGNLAIVDSIVTALGGNGITITGASTTLTLANSQVLVQAGNNVAPISVAGIYSIYNTVYDKPGSTFTGTSTNSVDYFQYINADNITTQGLIVTGSITVSGSVINNLTSSFAISSSQSISSSYAYTASSAINASASLTSISSSYALTASYALNGGGGGLSALFIADEGTTQGTASYINFTGAGVTATVSAGTASINITGGGSGISGLSTTFTQSVAATEWTFIHNLNTRYPLIQVYDTTYNQVTPQYVSSSTADTVIIGFGVPVAGYAVASNGGTLYVTGSNVILDQVAAATTWSFNHNLNTQYPIFQVFDSTNEVVVPQRIVATDATSSLIYFPSPVAGKAVASVGGISGSMGSGVGFPFSGSAVITGSFLVSQSFVDFSNTTGVTGSFSGSLYGTASYATFALSCSFAPGFTTNMSQSVAATTWSFTHNLNTITPIVQVYDLTNAQIIPNQIVGMNNSTVEVRFDYAQAGYAVASNGGGLYVTGSTSTLVQTAANVTWSFTHNLNNKYNTYEVYDDSDVVIIPSGIKALTNNTAEIYFSGPQTGRVVGQFSGINGAPNATTASFANTASFVSNLVQNVFITGSLTVTGSAAFTGSFSQNNGFVTLTQVSQSLNFANDAAAAVGGVPLGGLYRSGNFILIRLS